MLKHYQSKLITAGCDEAGRGCLAGPVVAGAVILPKQFNNNIPVSYTHLTLPTKA